MKKLFSIIFTVILLVSMTTTTMAATSGNKNTVVMKVKTQANWFKPGQESITLMTAPIGGKGLNGGHCYGIYKVELDGKYIGTLGNNSTTLYIPLKRNCLHTIRVAYQAQQTEKIYREKNRGVKLSGNPRWLVASSHKVSNYW